MSDPEQPPVSSPKPPDSPNPNAKASPKKKGAGNAGPTSTVAPEMSEYGLKVTNALLKRDHGIICDVLADGWMKQGFKPADLGALIAVMKRYGKMGDIVGRVSGIVGDVAHDFGVIGVEAALEAEAVQYLTDALRNHATDGEVQFNALYSLRWIAAAGKGNERPTLAAVANVEDIEMLIEAAVSLYGDDGGIVEEAGPLLDEVIGKRVRGGVEERKG